MKTNKKKILVPLLVLALVVTTIGGTLAWLMDKSGPVTNTFTIGNVDIALQEYSNKEGNALMDEGQGNEYHMVPGTTLNKHAVVELKADSEKAYVFVEVIPSANYTDFFGELKMNPEWTKLEGVNNVYYKKDVTEGTKIDVLEGNTVKVLETVTNEMMNGAKGEKAPTLAFKAYAVQKENINDAKTAWEEVQKEYPAK